MRRMLPKVLDIIKKYRTNDPNELAERLGIKVKYADMMGGPNGIFIKFVKKQVIYSSIKNWILTIKTLSLPMN